MEETEGSKITKGHVEALEQAGVIDLEEAGDLYKRIEDEGL